MENVLTHVGVMPNQLWPMPTSTNHATRIHTKLPNVRVTLEVFSGASRSPLHTNTHFDRFIYLAEGSMRIVSPKICKELKPGDGVIVRADHPHGFFIPDSGAKLVHVSVGSGVNKKSGQLPPHIQAQLAPIAHDIEAIKSLKHKTRWKDLYSQFEVQTMQWAKDRIIESHETGKEIPFELETHREKVIPMQGWKLPKAYILKIKGFALGFRYHNEEGREFVKVNRIFAFRFGLNRSDRKVQILK